MASVRIQGDNERLKGIYFEFDPDDAPLGEGGMGKVYKGWYCSVANDQRREVAIKFLYSDLPQHVIARARREASVQLRNDNLCEMLGFVEVRDHDEVGHPVIRYHVISEYLHGVTLDRLITGEVRDHRGKVIPYAQEMYEKYLSNPYKFAIEIITGLLSGLMALHDAGYIHRDIDPSNVMITSDRRIKLIDFGIAKKVDGTNNKENYTVAGQFMGKPKYAAPELVRGLLDSQNAATDLYSVGILLYQLVIGHAPFEGEMHDVLDMQLNRPMPVADIKQKQLRQVIRTATQKKRELRYGSAAEFRVALEKLKSLPYPGKTLDLPALPWNKIAIIAGSAVGVLILLTVILAVIGASSDDGPMDATASEEQTEDARSNAMASADGTAAYDEATALLADKATAQQGLEKLQKLADAGNYQATFMLSRLYFSSPESVYVGALTDSVNQFRNNLGLAADNAKAHKLLRQAVAINGNDYRSLFELGCDFKSRRRGATFNTDSAYIYLDRARSLAAKAGDATYSGAISGRISNLRPVKQP